MSQLNFPKNFYWGAGTSSHQVEGNTKNDWGEWEPRTADARAKNSKNIFWWNPNWKKFEQEATNPKNYIAGIACDHYNRFREDFDIAKKLHHNAHRFSIEWSRIEPEEGKWDEKEIEHYREVIHALREHGMEPFVTLLHFYIPQWLAKEGGITSKKFPEYFARYAKKMAEEFGFEVTFWVTLNEPDIHAGYAYLKGAWPPQEKCPRLFLLSLFRLAAAHRLAYTAIKQRFPGAQVGIAKHQIYFEMARPTFINHLLKALADWGWNSFFINRIKDHQDFIGLNHYNRNVIDNGFNKNPNKEQTDFGWEYHPESLYHALVELTRYGKPIYITENGIADASDEMRQRFIPEALTALHRAIEAGVDVRGYFYWSLLDNLELAHGFWLRFGLVHVDYATQTRTIRPSAFEYGKVAETNTLEV